MNLDNYPSNSNRSKEASSQANRKVEKIVTGNVKQKKSSGVSKLGSLIAPGDVENVKDYILLEVVVPTIKRAISDIVCTGINMLLGEPGTNKSDSKAARVSYRTYYDDDRKRYNQPRASQAYSYDDIIFDRRGDAEEVLYRMEELLERFEVVSVADLFDMAGISCNYTDNKYGWTSLPGAKVERVSEGYVIRLPKATSL